MPRRQGRVAGSKAYEENADLETQQQSRNQAPPWRSCTTLDLFINLPWPRPPAKWMDW